MQKKYWINKNIEKIEHSFNLFVSHNMKASEWDSVPHATAFIEKSVLFYKFLIRYICRSSYEGNEDTYSDMNMYSKEQLSSLIRFLIGLMVPKLKKKHVLKISEIVLNSMKYKIGNFKVLWYESYEYENRVINISDVYSIIETYLKNNNIYREKNEFIKC